MPHDRPAEGAPGRELVLEGPDGAEASGRCITDAPTRAKSEEAVDRLSGVEEHYELRTPAAVREYLTARPELLGLLCQVPAQARRYFGADSRFVLDVCPDREGSGPPALFAYIVTPLSADEAWPRLLRLEEDWWLDAAGDAPVNLHVEFA